MKRFYPRLAALTLWVTVGILALTAGMFFLLPRTADAALSGLISHRIYLPGLSEPGDPGRNRGAQDQLAAGHAHRYLQRTGCRGAEMARRRDDGIRRQGVVASRRRQGRLLEVETESGKVQILRRERSQSGADGDSVIGVELAELDTATLFFAGIPESVQGLPGRFLEETRGGLLPAGAHGAAGLPL